MIYFTNNNISLIPEHHHCIAAGYCTLSAVSFPLAMLTALSFRISMASPSGSFLLNYQSLMAVHAIILVFIVISLVLVSGLANAILPLNGGLSGILAMPLIHMNITALTMLAASALSVAVVSALLDVPALGWTLYQPLSSSAPEDWLTPLAILVIILAIGTINMFSSYFVTSRGSVATAFTWLPSYSIATFGVNGLLLLSLPTFTASVLLISIQTVVDPICHQHMFWWFGHPEVYVLIIPAFAMVTHSVLQFTGILGLNPPALAQSMFGIPVLGSVVWAHHMYTSSMTTSTLMYFGAASISIALPTGIKILHWCTQRLIK